MFIKRILKQQGISMYQLAKITHLPYMTINDICNSKVNIAECKTETIYKIAKALNVSMEEIVEPYLQNRSAFELFKSNVCHMVKEKGDIAFIHYITSNNEIIKYYDLGWYPESLYLLSMIDYLCRLNNLPQYREYDSIRKCRLKNTLFPLSIIALYSAVKDDEILRNSLRESIPEFLSHNIVESEIRNVI